VRVHGPRGKLSQEIRSFGATSDELLSLHVWLSAQRIEERSHLSQGVERSQGRNLRESRLF
jgi:hypothetical protein